MHRITFQTKVYLSQLAAKAQSNATWLQVYIPGIDGTGLAAWNQFPMIVRQFALVSLTVPVNDRSSFTHLVDVCVDYLEDLAGQVASHRPIYLLGESFGGLLAVAVAGRCRDIIDRIVLVNPATSYEESVWPQVRFNLQEDHGIFGPDMFAARNLTAA